ncbi:MAG: peptidylprolyl isomerase [archaeon]|nr:peptidylprolyl isomerase [archaeon]
MVEIIKKHDFIELEYTGKLNDGTVFDTTSEKVAKDNHFHNPKMSFGPVIICVGENQVLPGLDEALIEKELSKEYTVDVPAEKAFGKRDVKKMRIVPIAEFKKHKVQPQPGLQIDMDGEMGIITRIASGRVIVNFNHPLAGKEVAYTFKINRKVTDYQEQIVSFLGMVLRLKKEAFKVVVEDDKATIEMPAGFPQQFLDMLGKKLTEITRLKGIEMKSTSLSQ